MGQDLILTRADGTTRPLCVRKDICRITSGRQTWALNADDTLNITLEAALPQEFDIGDCLTVFGRDYVLNRLPTVRKNGARSFTYELEFEGVQYDLMRVTYDLTIDTTSNELQDVSGDSLTGDLRRFMEVLVANANRVFPGKWALGECPETAGDKTLTFGEDDNCLSVLQTLCSEDNFNVEFAITKGSDGVYAIGLYDAVGQVLPYTFRYGRGMGLYELGRENVSSANIVTRLKVFGSTENITAKYRANRLCLPGKSKGESYIEKEEAVSRYGIFEGRKNFDDIKPTFTGTVEETSEESVLQFTDTSFPFDLNAKDSEGNTLYLISGLDAKIHFNTGNLAGYDFTLKSYDHATHTFVLNKLTDDRGDVFPSETSRAFQFAVGDTYKITDIAYPSEIEEEAERELQEAAEEWYDQNCQPKVQYSLQVTKAWLESLVDADADTTVNVFEPGDWLHVVDGGIGVDKSVRIKSFTRDILDRYSYSLTISDTTAVASILTRVISSLTDINKILVTNRLTDPVRARANWRSSREVLDMVFDPEGDYYSEKIKPNSIDTLMLSVGAKSMQFCLTDNTIEANYNADPNSVRIVGGTLTHFTISDDGAVSWIMQNDTYTLEDSGQPYYIYAKCGRDGTSGTFVITREQHTVEEDAGSYYFWVGVINSVDPDTNVRSVAMTYGFTTVNGRFIKTGRIESADGKTYFDLDTSEISGKIVFITEGGEQQTVDDLIQRIDDTSKIFYDETPSPPYKKGDLWVTGEELLTCIITRKEGEQYQRSDWAEETLYDNTQTVIDGGIVTSGTVQVAGDETKVLAGITGKGTDDSSVRFWSGSKFEDRADAPCRITQDGRLYASNAEIKGSVTSGEGTIGGFALSANSMTATGESGADTMYLSNNLIRFLEYSSTDPSAIVSAAYIGGDTYPGAMGGSFFGPMRLEVAKERDQYNVGANVGVYVSVTGATRYDDVSNSGNHALYIPDGDIFGFRPGLRVVTASGAISNMDSVIVSEATSEITLTLPSDAQDGQILFIRKLYSNANITVQASGSVIWTDRSTRSSKITIEYANLAVLIYFRGYWTANYMTYND